MRDGPQGRLLKVLGVTFGVAVIIGGSVGVGILRRPGAVAAQLGNPYFVLAAWAIGGLYALMSASAIAELGAMLPQAGGFYSYARRAFGDNVGFGVGWCDWLGQTAAVSYGAVTMAEFSAALLPSLAPATSLLAIGVILLFAILQWVGVRAGSSTQKLTGLALGLAFAGLIASCFAFGNGAGFHLPAAPKALSLAAVILAAQSVIVSYDGWYEAIYFTEEDKNPGRNLPRSMICGVLLVTALYLSVNAALLYAMPIDKLAASQLAAADAVKELFGARGGRMIMALSILTLPPLVNASLLAGTRILFALSRDGLFWRGGAAVREGGTPSWAMILSTALAVTLAATGTFDALLAIAGVFYVVVYIAGFGSLFMLRRREPNLPRPFRVPFYPLTPLITMGVGLAFLAGALISDSRNSLAAAGLIAIGYPIQRFFRMAYRPRQV